MLFSRWYHLILPQDFQFRSVLIFMNGASLYPVTLSPLLIVSITQFQEFVICKCSKKKKRGQNIKNKTVYLTLFIITEKQKQTKYPLQVKWNERCSIMSDSLRPHGLYTLWGFPGQNTGVGSHFLLQGIFPTQGQNPSLPRGRQIHYQPSHKRLIKHEVLIRWETMNTLLFCLVAK